MHQIFHTVMRKCNKNVLLLPSANKQNKQDILYNIFNKRQIHNIMMYRVHYYFYIVVEMTSVYITN